MFQTIWQTIKVFLLFTGCTIFFYYGIIWISQEYENNHRYEKPKGSAVKVFQSVEANQVHWQDRLLLFYHDGE
ncbi:MAG: YqzK family protein [Bacillales bacterium]|nr:YqzK family protein [Bacillales bacterium]